MSVSWHRLQNVEPDLFTAAAEDRQEKDPSSSPLAVRMRPRTLDEVVGQQHLLKPGSPLRRLVGEGNGGPAGPSSVILWGPPGIGKTTLAYVVSKATNKRFVELSAITAGVKEVRAVIEGARRATGGYGKETVLFLDEIHRFSKAQQDSLLPAVENRWVTLIAATTENPYFSIISPLLSRSLLLTLESLTDDDLRGLLGRALADERGLGGAVTLPEEAEAHLLRIAGGDARRALTALEAAAGAALAKQEKEISLLTLEETVDRAAVKYDRDGDQHYDVASALIKSIRGSDVDAALHYLARMIEAGRTPVHRATADDLGQRGHRPRRPHGAAHRRRGRPGGRHDRFPGGGAHPEPCHHRPGSRPQVQRGDAGDLRRPGGRAQRPGGACPGPSARRPLQGRRQAGPRPGLCIRTMSPAASPPSSTHRTRCATSTTTVPRATARRHATRMWWSGSVSGSAARPATAPARPRAEAARGGAPVQCAAASKSVYMASRSSSASRTGAGNSKRTS